MTPELTEREQEIIPPFLRTKKQVLVCNVIVGAFIIIGNVVLPCFFWGTGGPSLNLRDLTPIFLNGILASEIAMIGTYAAFSRSFYVVRWAWSFIAAFLCALLLYIGVDIAESSSQMKASLISLIVSTALIGNLVVCGFASLARWYTGFHFVDASNSKPTVSSNSFSLQFLFRLMIAIALIMLLLRFFPQLQFKAFLSFRNALMILTSSTLLFLFSLLLVASSIVASMSVVARRRGFNVLVVSMLIGTPLLVAALRIALPTGISFWLQWMLTLIFYLGFVSSMLTVFGMWRAAGLRLSR